MEGRYGRSDIAEKYERIVAAGFPWKGHAYSIAF